MCFGGGGSASGIAARQAERVRTQEEHRKKRIEVGQKRIDERFSQFNPAYYDKFKQTYTGFYNPQIADQYEQSADKMTAALADRGVLESTTGANQFALLNKTRDDATTQVASQGVDAANNIKKQVEDTKTNLYSINQSTADPKGINAQALSQAGSIAAPTSFSPIGQVFASVMNPLTMYNRGDATSMTPQLPWNRNASYTAPLYGRGSSIYG